MMNRLLIFLTIICFSVSLSAADPVEKMLRASKVLAAGSNDLEALKTLQESLGLYKEAHVRSSIVELVSYSLLTGDGDFETFKKGIQKKYPQVDFSFVERNQGNYEKAIKNSAISLVLNASSASQAHQGNSPSDMKVVSRETARVEVDPFVPDPQKGKPVETNIVEGTQPVKPLPTEAEQAKEREEDIAKDSIYYKVYHAAVKIKSGDSKLVKEMIGYTFEDADSELTEAIVKAMAVGMLSAKSKKYVDYKAKVFQKYSEEDYFTFLNEAPFTMECRTCRGAGHTELKCRSCLTGDCRACAGSGTIAYKGFNEVVEKVCPACKGSKVCGKCEGEKVTKKACRSCGSKGARFNRNVLSGQFKSSIQDLIDITPKIAGDNNVYIGVGANPAALARLAALKEAKEERRFAEEEAAEAAREKLRNQELARLERQKEKAEEQRRKEKEEAGIIDVVTPVENGVNANLEHALLEVKNWFSAQEKRSKTSITKKSSAKYSKGNSILYVEVSSSFQNSGDEYKEQVAEGCYRFWKLRLKQNGAGGNPVMIMQFNGEAIAVAKDGEVTVK